MMEPEQFNPWVEASQGYLSPFLLGYNKNPIWTADPKNTPYRNVAGDRADPGRHRQDG